MSSKQNTWVLFLQENHPHTKPRLINAAFWQAQPLHDLAESVDLIAFKNKTVPCNYFTATTSDGFKAKITQQKNSI